MIERIKRFFAKPSHSLPVSFQYKGHRFYAFTDETNLIKQRQLIWAVKYKEIDLTVSKADLLAICEEGIKAINQGRPDQAATLLNFLEANIKAHNGLKNILSLANVIVLVDDEPIHELTSEHTALKERLCEESEEVRDFFLGQSIILLTKLGNITKDSTKEDFLMPQKVQIESQLLKLINTNIYQGWSKILTPTSGKVVSISEKKKM